MKTLALPAAMLRQFWNRLRRKSGAPRAAASGEALLEAVHAHNQLGEIAFFKNDLVTSVFHIIHGLNLAEALGPSPKLAEMYGAMMIVAGALPPLSLGEMYLRLSEQALPLADRAVTRAYVELLMGIFFNGRGRFAESQERLQQGLETFRRFGHGRRMEECLTNIFFLHLYRGEYAAAREAVTHLRRSAGQREDVQRLGWACTLGAHLELPTNGPKAMLEVLGSGDAVRWDALTQNSFHACCAVAHFRLGAMERAREQAQIALDRLSAGPPVSYTAVLDCSYVAEVFLSLLAQAQKNQQPTAELARQARRACATMKAFSRAFPVGWPRAHLWTGLERWLRGRKNAADQAWQLALAEAERRGLPRERAFIHAHRALLHGGSERARADELYQQIGAQSELAFRPLAR
jgi:hypothetical protein